MSENFNVSNDDDWAVLASLSREGRLVWHASQSTERDVDLFCKSRCPVRCTPSSFRRRDEYRPQCEYSRRI